MGARIIKMFKVGLCTPLGEPHCTAHLWATVLAVLSCTGYTQMDCWAFRIVNSLWDFLTMLLKAW